MKRLELMFGLVVLTAFAVWFVRPVVAEDEAPVEPNKELVAQVADLKVRVAKLERLLGENREPRPSVALRLESLELSIDELKREEDDDDADRGEERQLRDLTRRMETAETRIERMERNNMRDVERRLDGAERDIRGLESRVRRLE